MLVDEQSEDGEKRANKIETEKSERRMSPTAPTMDLLFTNIHQG